MSSMAMKENSRGKRKKGRRWIKSPRADAGKTRKNTSCHL